MHKLARQDPKGLSDHFNRQASPGQETEGTRREDRLESIRAKYSCPGFLLLDASFRPLYANQEALAALTFSANPVNSDGFDAFVENRVQSLFAAPHDPRQPRCQDSFASGRRCYQLRMFKVRSPLAHGFKPALAVLMERNHKPGVNLSFLAGRFHLTPREVETVDHLVQGFRTREIADRMAVSPNTVKAFLRSIMMKMGTDNRAGIIAKILHFSNAMNREAPS